jgi:hypothetical protein
MDGSNQQQQEHRYPEVVEDPVYTAQRQSIAGADAARLDAQLRGVEWAISQRPLQFPQVPGSRLRRVRTREWPDAPPFVIFFTIDGQGLRTLRSIERDLEAEEG